MFAVLHEQALAAAKRLKKSEAELVGLLLRIEECGEFKDRGYPSLFVYVQKGLKLSEACAYQLITVSRKCREVPDLLDAISSGVVTVSKAKAISSVLNPQNSRKWIDMAKKFSTRSLERVVAAERPGIPMRENVRYKGTGARISVDLDEEGLTALERSKEIFSQKEKTNFRFADAIKALAVRFVKQQDPVEKADRNAKNTLHVRSKSRQKHQVHRRDRGRCQFRLPTGELCGARQWLHVHHIKPKAQGGTDDPENLITLCSAHHRQVHTH